MLFLMPGSSRKRRSEVETNETLRRVKEVFNQGRFPVVTTECIEGKALGKVLGLVACRGFDSEEAFFGMTARAISRGAEGIIGYQENVAFHPDGSKFFSCYGTAVQFERHRRAALPQGEPEETQPDPTPPSQRRKSRSRQA